MLGYVCIIPKEEREREEKKKKRQATNDIIMVVTNKKEKTPIPRPSIKCRNNKQKKKKV